MNYLSLSVSLLIAQKTPSAMAAADASQTTPVLIMHVFMLCCFTQKCNFDSCRSLTCYMVCIK